MKKNLLFIVASLIVSSFGVAQPQLEQGKEMLKKSNYAEAVRLFKNVIRYDPKNDQAWYYLSKAYYKANVLDSAVIAANQAKSLNDENPDVYVVLAQSQLASNQPNNAYATTRAGLKVSKDYEPLVRVLGQIYLAMDSTDVATTAFMKAQDLNTTDPEACEGMGDAYSRTPATALAIMNYRKSLDLDSTQSRVWFKLAKALEKDRQYTESSIALQRVIALDTTNDRAYRDLADLFYRAKRYRDAAKWYLPYVQKHPEDREASVNCLRSLYSSYQYKDVIPLGEKLLKGTPNSGEILRMLAFANAELKKYDAGINYYMKLQKVDTLKLDDWKKLGVIYLETKKDSLAAVSMEEILKLDSTNWNVYFEVAVTYMRMKQWGKAADNFEKKFECDSTSFSAYYNYAACKSALGEFEDAARAYIKAIALRPDYAGTYYNLGSSYMQLKEWAKAKDTYEQYMKLVDTAKTKSTKELAVANKFVGLIYLLDKKYEEVVKFEKRSIEFEDEDSDSHTWLGQAYHNLQNNDKYPNAREDAIKEYKKALKINKNNKEAWKLLNMLDPQ